MKWISSLLLNFSIGGFDLSSWWMSNSREFPILSQIAKDVFAIPTSNVASENSFSLGKRIVDPYRASLTTIIDS